MEIVFFICVIFLPAIMGWGYLLYCFLRRGISHEKEQKKDQEHQQIWFYNCWLPLVIAALMQGLFLLLIVVFPPLGVILSPLAFMTTGVGYIGFYLLYHLDCWIERLRGGKGIFNGQMYHLIYRGVRLRGGKGIFNRRIFLSNLLFWGMIFFLFIFYVGSHF